MHFLIALPYVAPLPEGARHITTVAINTARRNETHSANLLAIIELMTWYSIINTY